MPTIVGNLKKLIRSRRDKKKQNPSANAVFRFKYNLFKELLAANSELFSILADMEEKLRGNHIFGASYVKNQVIRSLIQSFKMVKNLNVLSQNKFPLLYDALDQINRDLTALINQRKAQEPEWFVLPYTRIFKEDADWVGGKSANLGEIQNRLNLPVPAGFAITAKAYHAFLDENGLREEIQKRIHSFNADDVMEVAPLDLLEQEIRTLIMAKPVPEPVRKEILVACQALEPAPGHGLRVAMRSSAIGEDGALSFAGQYLTLLNLSPDRIEEAYQSIIASLFSARAMAYRFAKGLFNGEDLSMAVACIRMVDSVASGVMYTRHPFNILDNTLIINAVWGLGPYAVDGIIPPDTYVVGKSEAPAILDRRISDKRFQLVCGSTGGVMEIPVPAEKRTAPCLTEAQILRLASFGRQLEAHYQCGQDIEWALDGSGHIVILQSRPLKINGMADSQGRASLDRTKPDPLPGFRVIIEAAEVASQGIGFGSAFHVRSEKDLAAFPKNGILVAHHSSPEYVKVMPRCCGIITESGSISGHMAALAREFQVPALMGQGAGDALTLIPNGMEITLDGYTGRVYQDRVLPLITAQMKQGAHMKGTPVYELLQKVARKITPLNLINPKAPEFSPSGCKTLHDIGRFCHELSYEEMFFVSDMASKQDHCSFRLEAPLPIDLHIIDLGSGIKGNGAAPVCGGLIAPDQILSIPFLALLKGMLTPEVSCREPRPVNFSGLLSVMQEQILSPGHIGQRFGDRSYAIIADKYLNFSSRVGYHYSIIDAYCGETMNKNYISFSFKGGAADDTKKHRRARAIALILESLNYAVDIKADKVDARLQKYSCAIIQERLDLLGRLLMYTRQMDMLMTTEESIQQMADNFLAGNYRLSAP